MPQVSAGSAHSVIHSIIFSASTAPDAQFGLGRGMGTGVQRRHSPWPGGAHRGRVRRYAAGNREELECPTPEGPRLASQLPLHQLGP